MKRPFWVDQGNENTKTSSQGDVGTFPTLPIYSSMILLPLADWVFTWNKNQNRYDSAHNHITQ